MAGILAGRWRPQGVLSGPVYLHVNDRALDQQLTERRLASQRRQYPYAHCQFISVQQWRLIEAFSATQGDVVEMRGERRQVEIEPADLRVRSRCRSHFLFDFAYRQALKTCALEIEISPNGSDDNHAYDSCQRPADNPFPVHRRSSKRPARP